MPDIAKSGLHATTVCINDKGVMLMGEAGSGKTELGLLLLERAKAFGRAACFIADDRTLIKSDGEQLIVSVPDRLAGGVEIRGAGLFKIDYQKSCQLSLVVKLVSQEDAERFPSGAHWGFEGIEVPCLYLPSMKSSTDSQSKVRAVEFTLFGQIWP